MSLREESSMSFILNDDCTIFIEDNIKESKIEKVKTDNRRPPQARRSL